LPLPLIYQKGRGEWKDVPTIEAGFGKKRNEIADKRRRNLRRYGVKTERKIL
jgi:hypothetical protein